MSAVTRPASARGEGIRDTRLAVLLERWGLRGSVVGNALSLFGTSVVTSVVGFAFWFVAAHTFSRDAVGAGSAAISAMQLLAMASMLGLGTLLIGELSRGVRWPASMLTTAVITSAAVGAIAGCVFAVAVAAVSPRSEIADGILETVLFSATAGVSAALLVFDDATLGLSRASWQLWRNLVFAVLKLAALPVLAIGLGLSSSTGLLAAWLAGAVLSVGVVACMARRAGVRLIARPRRQLFRIYGGTALIHHCLNISSTVPRLVLPVLVAAFLTPALNASFYTALLLAGFAYVIPSHLAVALFGVAYGDHAALAHELRRSLRVSAGVGVGAALLFGFGGYWLLALFGHGYTDAATPLAILGAATFASGVKEHYVAVCRVNDDLGRSAVVSGVGSALEVALPLLALASHGSLVLVSAAWAVAMALEALVLWPAVAVAGDLPALVPVPRRSLIAWTAPHTFARGAGGAL